MPLATYKDLCIDVVDTERAGTFWAAVLGLGLEVHDDGDGALLGPSPAHTVWLNRVPEAKSVKHRVHLDVHAASVGELVALGARVLDDRHRWTVMADPEGGEFCAFVGDQIPAYRLYGTVVDGADHAALAAWWCEVLGGERGSNDEGTLAWIERVPGAPFDGFSFVPVPEAKQVKNRVHIDVTGDVDPLLDVGATLLRSPDDDVRWHVLADPEGNEFCVFAP